MSRLGLYVVAAFLAASQHYSCSVSTGGGGSVSSGHTHYLAISILAGLGLLFFYAGFRNYRKLRILEDTPMMPIRSIPMGLVHIRGKATGDERVTSPITHVPCFYYVVKVEKWMRSQKGGGVWSICLRHVDHVEFHLQDETGKVLIDPHQAELDLPQTFLAETGPNASRARTIDPSLLIDGAPSASELRDYLSQTNAKIQAEMAAQHKSRLSALAQVERSVSLLPAELSPQDSGQHLRFTEQCLLPDREYNILGTCVENPNAQDASGRNMIARGQNEPTFLITWKTELALEKQTRRGSYIWIPIGAALLVAAAAVFLSDMGLF